MNAKAALAGMRSKQVAERLAAVRALSKKPSPQYLPQLEKALLGEEVPWIRNALRIAISKARGEVVAEAQLEGEELSADDDFYAKAVQEVTGQLIHEVRPVLGRIENAALDEVKNYDRSRTKGEVDFLRNWLTAFESLGRAAKTPLYKEFNLSGLISEIIHTESLPATVPVSEAQGSTILVVADPFHVEMIVRNALRNAVESTLEAKSTEPIVMNWGKTDTDYWITILDRGVGLPSGDISGNFDVGKTSKSGHLGMGLALANRAALSLKGEVSLLPRERAGARFHFRWRIPDIPDKT